MRASRKDVGFTIVELLIVIVVIGILAAIVTVAYNGVQKRANDAAVRSDLAQMAKKLEAYKVTSSLSRYPTTSAELEAAGIRLKRSNYQEKDTNGNLRNNIYYIISSSASPEGLGQRYAVGTAPQNGLTSAVCIVDGQVVVAACNGGDVTRQLLYPDETTSFTKSSWAATGHSSTAGWQTWTGG